MVQRAFEQAPPPARGKTENVVEIEVGALECSPTRCGVGEDRPRGGPSMSGKGRSQLGTALIAAMALLPSCQKAPEEPGPISEQIPVASIPGEPDQAYDFSYDWTTRNIPVWTRVLGPLMGKPDLNYLEVGVFEGRTVAWMLENVLTHPTARLTGIDIFLGDVEARYLATLEATGQADKATTIKGYSQVELKRLPPESFDIIYVDGSHTAEDVLADAVLSWQLLKDDGLLIFDDYLWLGPPSAWRLPPELRPGVAIDAFITSYRNYLTVVHRDYQVIVRKRDNPCPEKWYCSAIGGYFYSWDDGSLSRLSDYSQVALTEREQQLIETMLRSKPFGGTEIVLDESIQTDPDLIELLDRLGVRLPEQP